MRANHRNPSVSTRETPRDRRTPAANNHDKTILLFGETLVDVFSDRSVPGGAPFNVTRHLQGFGLHPVLISRTGDDLLGDELVAGMSRLRIDTRGLQTDRFRPTGQVLVHRENGGHRFEILPEQAYDFIDADEACAIARTLQPGLIYFGTLAQRHPVSRRALEAVIENIAAPQLFLDINLRMPWYQPQTLRDSIARADILKLNVEELHRLGSLFHLTTPDDRRLAGSLLEKYRLTTILVTCGGTGAWMLQDDGSTSTAPGRKTLRIVDTVGAGDGFSAVCILGLLNHWSPEQTLYRADAFARSICEIRGAVPEDDNFYDSFRIDWELINGDHP